MRGLLKTSSTFGFACLGAFLGAGAFVILTLHGGDSAPPPSYNPDLPPADAVAFRFPFDWNEATANPPPAEIISASYTGVAAQQELLNPRPTYQLASVTGYVPTMAYAPEKTATAVAKVEPTAHPSQTTEAPAHVAKASVAAPAKPAAPRNTRQVLNSGQIAGIKRRLNLTPDQERYWPQVEVALRQMAWTKSGKGEAKVDMSTVDVDGLKSAAFPLVMSFSDDQKRELRSLAHLLGLESVASRF
jgi:hypothetical protein